MKVKNSSEGFYYRMMTEHKKKLIYERKKELQDLRKRIKHIEQDLEGMGIIDFELQKHDEIN